MKQWIIVGVLLLLGIAAVWVVVGTLLSGPGVGLPLEIPEGRYDGFLLTHHNVIVRTTGFPNAIDARGEFPAPPKPDYEETRKLMDFDFHMGVYHKDKTFARFAAREAFRRIGEIETRLSLDRKDSELSKINKEAFDKPVKLSDELYFILKRARQVSLLSDGAFDVTGSPLRWMWQHYAAYDQAPPSNKMREVRALVDWHGVRIDDETRTVRLAKKGVIVGLHDIIRGFCLDQAAYELRRQGMRKGFIRTGDTQYLLGSPDGEPFIIGIPASAQERKLKYTFDADRPAVAMKGFYTGYKFLGNTIVSDIVDPRSGSCVGSVGVCVVVGPDGMTCDAMATAICVLGGSRAVRFIAKFNPREEHPE